MFVYFRMYIYGVVSNDDEVFQNMFTRLLLQLHKGASTSQTNTQ